jgi:hypothetical protein
MPPDLHVNQAGLSFPLFVIRTSETKMGQEQEISLLGLELPFLFATLKQCCIWIEDHGT